jgi:eukaryotic-like serine/threonine-protein kinase
MGPVGAAVARHRSSEEHDELLGGGAPFAGKYAVERILGIGGMGTVFEARHLRLGHRVAIKVLGSELRDYPELVTRFEREARAAGSLSSRHAVRVFDIDMTEDATPFIVMELLSGQDLARIVEREGPQPVQRAVRWVIEACDAIAEAHSLGIVHRDLKPSNLFLTAEGVKVLDFGIAKRVAAQEASITQSVAPLGTPQYMSPEQVRCAKDVDTRTDVWSLGVTLFELLTGKTPYAHEIPQACIASIAADPVPDPRTLRADLSPELVDVIMKAVEKDPADRFASVPELVRALAPFAMLDVDVDDEPSTAVRRIVENATRALRSQDSTLDGEPSQRAPAPAPTTGADAPKVAPELLESGVRTSRPPMDSKGSLPPTVTKIPPPPRNHLRSRFAVVGAAVLGLAAVIVTPMKCVGRVDARSPSPSPSPSNVTALAPTMKVEPVAIAPAGTLEIREENEAPAPAPEKEAVASPIAKKPAPAPPATSVAKPALNLKPAAPPVVIYGDNSAVHGGLSSPGF